MEILKKHSLCDKVQRLIVIGTFLAQPLAYQGNVTDNGYQTGLL